MCQIRQELEILCDLFDDKQLYCNYANKTKHRNTMFLRWYGAQTQMDAHTHTHGHKVRKWEVCVCACLRVLHLILQLPRHKTAPL